LRSNNTIDRNQPLTIGDFVSNDVNDLGVGKLKALHGTIARVTWFHSPTRPIAHEEHLSLKNIKRVDLGNQHRVYHYNTETGVWQVGRIDDAGRISGHHFDINADLYFIAFPNGNKRRVPIEQLETRWDRPLDDPASILASRTTETPFWHEGRALLMRSAMAQRAACGGLTGLFSSSVDLQAHQVRVVRAVLNDPIPRYLLADEVGLGKTIEALAILRQLVIERPDDHETLIVAPLHIQEQWREELTSRFGLGPLLGSSIRILSLTDLGQQKAPHMLIVDEAHHPSAYAYAHDSAARALYKDLARLAHESPSVLLLSATPVLRNEDGFLAMLHLLDPAAYPLDDRKAFRERIEQRQQIADWLGDLQDDAPPMFTEETLHNVIKQLGSDTRLVELARTALPFVDEDEDHAMRKEVLAAVRAYIGEVYRLHRRLLRTRRRALAEPLWGRIGAKSIRCEDSTRAEAEHLLLEWRAELALAIFRQEVSKHAALALWRHFLEAALSHPTALRELVSARLERREPKPELASCPASTLHAPWLFESEEARLREIADVLDGYKSARDEALLEHLKKHSKDRFLVFVDRKALAEQLYKVLVSSLGEAVRLHRGHNDVLEFTQGNSVRVLLCDVTAEEGLNLHYSPATLIHYDLPLAPNRIEQRVGRLDRFGAKKPVASLVFEDGAPLPSAWLSLLSDPIGVFNDSIASLQYVLDAHLQTFIETSLDTGLEAFESLAMDLRDEETGLAAELKRIQRQEALDALDADPREQERFEEMESYDLDDDQLRKEFEAWLVDRLQFHCKNVDPLGRLQRYAYQPKGHRLTLIPIEHWLRWFSDMVKGAQDASSRFVGTPELTYRRRQAHLQRVPLVRIGHPLFDGAVRHAKQDDRGVAFAMWRWRPDCGREYPLVSFRFDFVVEADPEQTRTGLGGAVSTHNLQRRLDALLSPQFVTIWLDDDLQEIKDPKTLLVLSESYNKKPAGGGSDRNLVGDRWVVVDEFCPVASWESLVEAAMHQATQTVLKHPNLIEDIKRAQQDLATQAAKVTAQLAARVERIQGPARSAEEANLEHERLVFAHMKAALERPLVRPDSVGVIFLSSQEARFGGVDP
jgi:ATP-dependent helicase HepA